MSVTFQRDPQHGRDPWLGPRAMEAHDLAAATVTVPALFTGADTVGGDIGLLPDGLDAYMSYVDNFGGYNELVARFGHTTAFLVSITIFGNRARCADVEPGAMSAASFGQWLGDGRAIGNDQFGPPWGYASASNMAALINAAAGRPFIRWSAHFGFGPHICGPNTCGFPQAHWTQWDDHGAQGQNIDRSIGRVLTQPAPPPPTPTEDGMITAATLNGIPHVFVERTDGSVWYTFQPAGGGHGWEGGQPGKQIAGLRPFAPPPGK
jgi:hypothetical protein